LQDLFQGNGIKGRDPGNKKGIVVTKRQQENGIWDKGMREYRILLELHLPFTIIH